MIPNELLRRSKLAKNLMTPETFTDKAVVRGMLCGRKI